MEPIVKRLEIFLEHRKLNPNKLSELLGYNKPEKLYRLFRVENAKPSVDILEDVSNLFEDLNTDWLLTGRGQMLKTDSKDAHTPVVTLIKDEDRGYAKHIPLLPHDDFGRNSGQSLARKGRKRAGNSEKPDVLKCSECEAKDEIISAKTDLIDLYRSKEQVSEQLIHEKQLRIEALEREKGRLERLLEDRNEKAG